MSRSSRIAFGLSLFVTGFITVFVVVLNPSASLNIYAALFVILIMAFGAFWALAESPELYRDAVSDVAEAKRVRYAADHLGEATSEAAGVTVENDLSATKNAPSPLCVAWGGYLVRRLEAVRNGVEQGPHYSGGWDAVMDYQVWKVVVYILRELNLIDPVTNRQRTVFADGVNATSAALVVRACQTIPLPPMVTFNPPNTEQEKQEENSNSEF